MSKLKDIQRQVGFSQETVRANEDYYITPEIAVKELLARETFTGKGWECACGNGAISQFFPNIMSSDIRITDDVAGEKGVDFLKEQRTCDFIVTNPPFKLLLPFMKHSLECANKVAIFCRIQALEGKARYEFYKESPPKTIYVFVNRISCFAPSKTNINQMEEQSGIMCFCWLIFEKGFKGKPTIEWILTERGKK